MLDAAPVAQTAPRAETKVEAAPTSPAATYADAMSNQCGVVAQKFLSGLMIPFLGAGASSYEGAFPRERPPNAEELIEQLSKEAGLDVSGQDTGGKPRYDLPRVASYYQLVAETRLVLDERIRCMAGDPQYRPNRLHRTLARAAKHQPMLIITTNYDTMIETALYQAGAAYEVVATAADRLAYGDAVEGDEGATAGMIYHKADHHGDFEPIDPRQLEFDLTQRSVVYKVHGSVPAGSKWEGGYLVAEEDYTRFLGRMDREHIYPHKIKNIIGKKRRLPNGRLALVNSLLFLGYSLNDWNLRVLMDEIGVGQGRAGEERHYAVMRSHDDVAQRLLDKRNIAPWVLDLSDFVVDLDRKLTETGIPDLPPP